MHKPPWAGGQLVILSPTRGCSSVGRASASQAQPHPLAKFTLVPKRPILRGAGFLLNQGLGRRFGRSERATVSALLIRGGAQ